MTEPTTHHPSDLSLNDPDVAVELADSPDVDLVPGDPPVPITVWRTPAGDGTGLSPRLAARLLAAYTRAGDVVFDATTDQVFARAVDTAARRYATHPTQPTHDADRDGLAALVLAGWPLPGSIDPVIVLGGLGRRLSHRGVLAVVITDPYADGVPVEVGPPVSAARAARLSYLQHIVAVHARVDGDHVTVPNPAPGAGGGEVAARIGDGAHLRVHTDLLIFTRSQARHA
jgi:hypothetical protein